MQGPPLIQFLSESMMSCRLKCIIGNLNVETSIEGLFQHPGADYNKWFSAALWLLWLNDLVIYALFVLISTYSKFPVIRLRLIWSQPKLSRTRLTSTVTAVAESVPSLWRLIYRECVQLFPSSPVENTHFRPAPGTIWSENGNRQLIISVYNAHLFFPKEIWVVQSRMRPKPKLNLQQPTVGASLVSFICITRCWPCMLTVWLFA